MEITRKQKIIGLAVYTVAAVAAGRYLVPESIKTTETKQVVTNEQDNKDEKTKIDDNRKTHKETITTSKTLKDGTKETITKVVEDTSRDTDTVKDDTSNKTVSTTDNETSTKTVQRGSDKVTILTLAGVNPFNSSPTNLIDYGISVSKPILGPVAVSVWGFKSGMIGAGVGLQF